MCLSSCPYTCIQDGRGASKAPEGHEASMSDASSGERKSKGVVTEEFRM